MKFIAENHSNNEDSDEGRSYADNSYLGPRYPNHPTQFIIITNEPTVNQTRNMRISKQKTP